MYPSGHADPKVAGIIAVLQRWYDAMQDGSVQHWYPQLDFKRRNGKPLWSDEELDRLIAALDEEFDKELSWAKTQADVKAEAGPGFSRLTTTQRLVLAQELDAMLRLFEEHPPELSEKDVAW